MDAVVEGLGDAFRRDGALLVHRRKKHRLLLIDGEEVGLALS